MRGRDGRIGAFSWREEGRMMCDTTHIPLSCSLLLVCGLLRLSFPFLSHPSLCLLSSSSSSPSVFFPLISDTTWGQSLLSFQSPFLFPVLFLISIPFLTIILINSLVIGNDILTVTSLNGFFCPLAKLIQEVYSHMEQTAGESLRSSSPTCTISIHCLNRSVLHTHVPYLYWLSPASVIKLPHAALHSPPELFFAAFRHD